MDHDALENELNVFKRIENSPIDHPGRGAVRSLLDTFEIDGPNGRHRPHTDISETNIQFGTDEAVLSAFEQEELDNPCPRKEAGGRTVYESRLLQAPKNLGAPVLCDFGSAMRLDDGIPRLGDIQPITYRAPEVILEIPWTSSVDIWNVGCMIWDTVQGETLFTGHDPELKTYRGRAHLAEMISDSAPWTSAAEPPRPNKLEKQLFFR
ncbi:hypothetical protein E4U11_008007 [Claviceps purpurea]|nr:hypothetical protein E4U11_008007 [Claviceps purpurea]